VVFDYIIGFFENVKSGKRQVYRVSVSWSSGTNGYRPSSLCRLGNVPWLQPCTIICGRSRTL